MENNIKIRSIEIEAFRGYNKRMFFDFTIPGGNLADLIVIYAPNGFGKTSFFDGVEWAVKGSIERFRDDTLMMQTAIRERGDILRNSESELVRGRIKIIDEDNNFFERFTSVISEQWDLVKGSTNSQSTSKIKHNLEKYEEGKRIEILPQSRVDAFISSKKPTERYEALVNFWGGQDDSDYYRAINELVKHSDKINASIETKIKEIKEEIITLLIPDERSLLWEDLKTSISEKGIFGADSLFYKEVIDISSLNNLTIFINTTIVELENKKQRLVSLYSKSKELPNQYTKYNANKTRLDSIQVDMNSIKRILSTARENIVLSQNIVIWNDNILIHEDELKDFNFILENATFYRNFTNIIVNGNNSVGLLKLETQDLTNRLRGLEYDRLISSQQIAKILAQRHKILNIRDSIIEIKNNYTLNYGKSSHFKSRKALSRKIYLKREEHYKEINNNIIKKRALLSINIDNLHASYFKELNNPIIDKLLQHNIELQELKRDLDTQNKMLQGHSILSTNLQSLVSLGHQLVLSSSTNTCPLCNTIFKDYNSLLENINIKQEDFLGTEAIRNTIDRLNFKFDIINTLIESAIKEFLNKVNNEIRSLETTLEYIEKKYNKVVDYVNYYTFEEQIIESNLRKLINNLVEYDTNIDDIDEKLDTLRINISIEDTSLEAAKLTLTTINNNIDEIGQKLASSASKIAELESEIFLISNDSLYTTTKELLIKRNLDINFPDDNDLLSRLAFTTNQINILKDELAKGQILSTEYNNDLKDIDIQSSRETLQALEYELNSLNISLTEFRIAYFELIGNYNYNINALESNITKLNSEIIGTESEISLVRQYKENIDINEININVVSKRASIAQLEEEYSKHKSNSIILKNIHKNLSIFLKNKINSIFNHEFINDIYQKIDPHPNFKNIKLEPVFNDKPELIIRVYDSNNEITVDPILYLSSAQVSILSLSIFFAKAMQNSDPLINTIFMDDPIQYMDSINILSFIDLIRSIISDKSLNRQIVLSTHDENFFRLLQRKFDTSHYKSKFIEFETYGVLK